MSSEPRDWIYTTSRDMTLSAGRLGQLVRRGLLTAGVGGTLALMAAPLGAVEVQAYSGYGGQVQQYGHLNLCVDDTGWSTTQGTRMQLYPCTGNSNQHWNELIVTVGTPTGQTTQAALLQNAYSGLCLNVSGASRANFTPAIQWGCSSTYTNELFKVLPAPGTSGPPNFNFWAGWIGTCLDDPYNSGSSGTKLEFYQCNESVAQTWRANGMIGVWP